VVLFTLGGHRLLDGLVACGLHYEAHMKVVCGFGEGFVRGGVFIPREMQRATLVEVRCEERQVVWPDRSSIALV
jgi:hypothetical protein